MYYVDGQYAWGSWVGHTHHDIKAHPEQCRMRHLLFKRTAYFVLLAEAKVKPKIPQIHYCHVKSRTIIAKVT